MWRRVLIQLHERLISIRFLDQLGQDLRLSARALRKDTLFTTVVTLSIALSVAATTTVYAVVYGVVLRPLPFDDSSRLVRLQNVTPDADRRLPLSYLQLRELTHHCDALEGVATYLFGAEPDVRVPQGWLLYASGEASPALFRVLRVATGIGRSLADGDLLPGAPRVAVVSHRLWKQHLGGTRNAVGRILLRRVRDREEVLTIVGVLPPGFEFPYPSQRFIEVDIWTPFDPAGGEWDTANSQAFMLPAIARLRGGVSLREANAQIETVNRRLVELDGGYRDRRLSATLLQDDVAGAARLPLLVSLGAVGLVLLVGVANVASLVLARGVTRAQQHAIKSALGGGLGRRAREALTESLMLAVPGGLVGIGAATCAVQHFVAAKPSFLARAEDISVDWPVVCTSIALTAFAVCAMGVCQIVATSRLSIAPMLSHGGPGGGASIGARRQLRVLVVAQLAIAMVLLLVGGLLTRSFVALVRVDLGFDPASVVAFDIRRGELSFPRASTVSSRRLAPADTSRIAALDESSGRIAGSNGELERRVMTLPGVLSAGVTTQLPLGGQAGRSQVRIEGCPERGRGIPLADVRSASAGFFRAARMRLRGGRWFDANDREGSPRVAIINEAMAKAYWPGSDPVGRHITVGRSVAQIVGILEDVLHFGPFRQSAPEVYLPDAQVPRRATTLIVRTSRAMPDLESIVRSELRAVDTNATLVRVRALEGLLADILAPSRCAAEVFGALGVVFLLLAAVGVHGVLRRSVSLRLHEFGVRMALGASRGNVFRVVLKDVLLWSALGWMASLIVTLAVGRVLRGFLYGVSAADTATWLVASGVFLLAVLAAAYDPAISAMRADPVRLLRTQ